MSVRMAIMNSPSVRWLRRLRHERRVRYSRSWRFWGVFPSYEAAARAAHENGASSVGYDTPAVAGNGREQYERFHRFDYPALLWIARLALTSRAPGETGPRRIVDLGGHLGEKFRVYARLWPSLAEYDWIVCDTPAAIALASHLPESDLPQGLSFTSDLSVAEGAHVLFASGVVQYLDRSLPGILGGLQTPPRHLVVNKIPLSERPDHWTVQNVGATVVPYHISNRDRFLGDLGAQGYRILDDWEVPEFSAPIPFHPGLGTTQNSGLALSRE